MAIVGFLRWISFPLIEHHIHLQCFKRRSRGANGVQVCALEATFSSSTSAIFGVSLLFHYRYTLLSKIYARFSNHSSVLFFFCLNTP